MGKREIWEVMKGKPKNLDKGKTRIEWQGLERALMQQNACLVSMRTQVSLPEPMGKSREC